MLKNNILYTAPGLRYCPLVAEGLLCQSNGAHYDPTQEVQGITWDED